VLIRRIEHLLEGYGDPLWSKETLNRVYATTKRRNATHRAKRFIELLKTVDGIYIQRLMAVPEEKLCFGRGYSWVTLSRNRYYTW